MPFLRLHGIRLAGTEHGSVLPFFAVAAFALFGFGALGIDTGQLYLTKSRLQGATDAAALAAVERLPDIDQARAAAAAYAASNLPATGSDETVRAADVQIGRWDPASRTFVADDPQANAVRVVARRGNDRGNAVPTLFAGLIGHSEADIAVEAIAVRGSRGLELAMVLDVSGSMAGSKIQSLQTAAKKLLDILYAGEETVPELWVGLAPFSARVNIMDYGSEWMKPEAKKGGKHEDGKKGGKDDDRDQGSRGANNLCTDYRSAANRATDAPPSVELFPPFEGDASLCPKPPVLALTAERSTVEKAINKFEANGGTSTHIGTVWGWRVLSPRWRGLWGDPELPLDYEALPEKAVIIMTDGENTGPSWGDLLNVQQANDQLLQECAAMKAEGIIVYTITFQAPPPIRPLYQQCASKPEYAFESPTNQALENAFEAIGVSLAGIGRLVH
jgi:Flp pilus assembly protein TadG